VAFSPQLAESLLDGQIATVNAADGSFTLALAGGQMSAPNTANGPTLSVNTNDNTVYQGINGFSLLTVGTFVDMDAAIQSDGSELATRIAVEDTDTTNLSVSTGPLLQVAASQPSLFGFGRQDQGYLWTAGQAGNFMPYSFSRPPSRSRHGSQTCKIFPSSLASMLPTCLRVRMATSRAMRRPCRAVPLTFRRRPSRGSRKP